MAEHVPADADELAALVRATAAAGESLAVLGAGTKGGWGRPVEATHALRLERISGVVEHDASELTLTAHGATPLAAIEQQINAAGQCLAFEPPDWAPLLGAAPGRQTIGGVLAAAVAGPRRVNAGAARDHLLGFAAVNGRGERFRAGGRVVKNVTGYDLPKLLCGSFGTLAVLTEVTLRLHPAPATERTIAVSGLDDARAAGLFAAALGSPLEITGAAHLPRVAAERLGLPDAATLLRVEGHGPSVAFRSDELATLAGAAGPVDSIEAERSRALWRSVADAAFLAPLGEHVLWRLSVVPSHVAELVTAIRRTLPIEHALDWGGGLVWCAVAPEIADGGAAVLRAALPRHGGGQATLFRAPAALRAAVDVFDPAPPVLADLRERVRRAFDPLGVFNPGRLVAVRAAAPVDESRSCERDGSAHPATGPSPPGHPAESLLA